jgi:hypothetical protein
LNHNTMSPNPHVLLLGGHGKVSLLLTPLLLSRSWRVTSVIRDPAQKAAILEAGKNGPGEIDVLVESLEEVRSDGDAAKVLEKTRPDYVVWSAGMFVVLLCNLSLIFPYTLHACNKVLTCPSPAPGAGGKGGPSRTNAIDCDAARHYISASVSSSSVQKFLMISALSIRRKKAEWWSDEDWEKVERTNMQVMPAYYRAKLAADELLTVLGEKKGFQYIILRPGGLTNGDATGRVALGKTRGWGQVRRADVADVAARLLEVPGARGWFDLLEGEEDVGEAVERVVRDKIDSREGESLGEMEKDTGRIW